MAFFMLRAVGTLVALASGAVAAYVAYDYDNRKEDKENKARQYCSNNDLNIRIIYDDDDQPDILFSKEETNMEVSLVFSSVFLFESPEYAHVTLKFHFNYHGREITVFIAGVCSDKAHVLEPEVSFKPPNNIFKTTECGRIFMAPYALMEMCENNPSNYTIYDIYKNNCYKWTLDFGLMAGGVCGKRIVSIIRRLTSSQNKFIVTIGDIGHLFDLPKLSASSLSNSRKK